MKTLITLIIFISLSVPSYAGMCGFFGFGCNTAPQQTKITTLQSFFEPTFENVNVVTQTTKGPWVNLANNTYFATEETAQELARKFGAARVEYRESIQNLGGNYLYADGALKGTPAIIRVLVFVQGSILKDNAGQIEGRVTQQFEINAGWLADYYRRIPEKQFPAYISVYGNPPVETHYLSLAEQYVWRVLVSVNQEAAEQTRSIPTVHSTPL